MKTIAKRVSVAALLSSFALPAAAQPPPPAPPAPAQPAAPPAAAARAPAQNTAERSASLEARIGALFATQGGLTSDAVATRAAATSFDVQAKHADVEAAAAALDQAIVQFIPQVSFTARYMRLSPIPDFVFGGFTIPSLPNATTLHANVTIPISDYVLRISRNYAASSRSLKAAELNEQATKLKVALDGRFAYYTWARARLSAFVAKQALEQAKQHLTDARHQFEVGAASKADVLRVEAQVASGENLAQRADGLARTSEESVRLAMHEGEPARVFTLGEDLRAPLPPLAAPRTIDALYGEALQKRLEIRALDETAWSLKDQAWIARAGMFPRVDALGQVAYDNPEQRVFPPSQTFKGTWAAGIQATWTLNDIAGGAYAGKQVDAKQAQILAQKRQVTDALRLEISQAEQALEDAEVAIETSTRALAAAEESYRVRRELFQNGRATSVELTDAETEQTRASLDVVNARVDLRVARARLLHAIGRDVVTAAP